MLVTPVCFADSNLVYESVGIESGLGSAVVNRSRNEISAIREMLAAGREPERNHLLMQSARSALSRGQRVLAVVVSFQALEIVIETRLRTGYTAQGLTEPQITAKLKTRHRTKDRLTTLSREVFGGRSVEDDTSFWNAWLADCNQRRNSVVHRGEEIGQAEAKRLVELCEECIARFSAL